MAHEIENSSDNLLSDEQLLKDVASGNTTAFTTIVEQHQAMVYRTCLRVLGNDADAQDAAQATLIIFHQKCRTLKNDIVLGGWLYRTAELVCREHIRSSGRRKRREDEAMKSTTVTNNDDMWNTLQPELDSALTELHPKYRDVIVLRYLEGKSTNEAAAIMRTSASSVTTRLARAIEQLRACFLRRGVGLTAAALSAMLAQNASAAAVPPTLGASILGVTGVAGAATAAGSTDASIMAKGALAKLGTGIWPSFYKVTNVWLLIGDVLSMHTWAKGGFRFPRWVHIFAQCMFISGVVGVIALYFLEMLTFPLALGCIIVPPAAAYTGWVWVWGPLLEKDRTPKEK